MNLISIHKIFPTEEDIISHLELIRWGSSPECTYCQSKRITNIKKEKRYHCNNCNTSFSVTVRTIFNRTHISLHKWLLAIWLVSNSGKKISARQLGKEIQVNKNTAWRMINKIKNGLTQQDQKEFLVKVIKFE